MISFLAFLRSDVLDDDYSDSRECADTYSMDAPLIDRNEVISRHFEDELSRVGFARVLSNSDSERQYVGIHTQFRLFFQIKTYSVEIMS